VRCTALSGWEKNDLKNFTPGQILFAIVFGAVILGVIVLRAISPFP